MKRVGIVGYGAIAPLHAMTVDCLTSAKLSAVCDINPECAEKAAEIYDIKIFTDYDEMLKSGEIDAVHICTPHYLHKEMAVKALRAGCDVVMEKPVAMNEAELEDLISEEKQSKGRLCIMLQNRTNFCIRRLEELIKDTEYSGELISINGFLTWNRDERYYSSGAWRGKWATEGGGVLINQAIHLIDLIGFLGGRIDSVRGSISTKRHEGIIEVEDTADALFMLKNGNRACFYATNASGAESPVQLDVYMEKVHYRYADNSLYEIKNGKFSRVICTNDDAVPGKKVWGNGHKNVIESFYDETAESDIPYPTLDSCINSTRALFAFYKSAKDNCGWVKVD